MNILDDYVRKAPANQNAIDIFKDAWTSRFPHRTGLTAGPIPLFEDARILWLVQQLGGIEGNSVLELGPLEGAHTYMLEKLGAREIVAVEGNAGAYLRCLITKEIMRMDKAHFLLGDVNAYLEECELKFDLCVASGVLYHMRNPVRTLELLSKVSDKVFIWTHFYEASICRPQLRFAPEPEILQWRDVAIPQYQQSYGDVTQRSSFCGGNAEYSIWLEKSSIETVLEQLGFTQIIQMGIQLDHPSGPAYSLLALR